MAALDLTRKDIAALRQTLARLGAVVAEVDAALRYVWIDNPHPDFDATAVIGKRDDELLPAQEAAEIMELKRDILRTGESRRRLLKFNRTQGEHCYLVGGHPIRDAKGKVSGVFTCGFEVPVTEASDALP
jgi:hypothetical protein